MEVSIAKNAAAAESFILLLVNYFGGGSASTNDNFLDTRCARMKLICTSAAADKLEQPLLLLPNTRVRIPITSIIFLPLSIMRLFNNATTRGVGWVR